MANEEQQSLIGMQKKQHTRKLYRLKYSCEEVYERMDNGLCIFCDELDTPGHHDLKHKGIQIFIVDDDLACNDVEDVHQNQQAVKNPDPFVEPVKNSDALIEPLDCASVLQVLDSVVLMIHKVDSHVNEVEKSSQQSTNGNGENSAHQLFDQKPVRVTNKEKHLKHLKGWKFKFKGKNLSRALLQIEQYELMERKCKRYNKFSSNIQVEPMRTRIAWEHWRASKRQRISLFQLRYDIRSYLDVFLPIWLTDETQEKQHTGLSRAERVWKPGELMFLRKQWDWRSNVHNCGIIVKIARRLYGDSIVTMSAKFRETYEEPEFELMCLKQSHDSVENYLNSFGYALPRSSLQHTPTNQYRAPFNPYQNRNNQCHYKREFGNYTGYEIEFDRECEEIEDDELKDKQPEEDVETLVISENTQSLECDEEESCDDREPSEVTVEEIIDKSVDMIREEKPTPENESSPQVSLQILPSQFQVSLSSLEPGCRYHKESLVVVNDLTYDHGCVIGKTIGSVCVSELGQANSHDEEEFKGLNLGKLLENERLLSIVFLLGLNDMSCWTQLLRQQIFPKSWRFKFKTESSGEAILLNTYRAVCLGVYNSSLEEKLELSGWKYKKQINQGHICLNGLCNELICDEEKKRESIEFNECHNHLKKLQAALEGIPQKIAGGLIYGVVKFHLKHKWRSRLEFCVDNAILFTSSVKLLFPKNHKLLYYEVEFCAQYNDLKQLSTEFQSFPGLDNFTYLIVIWNQTLNCGCEAGHISSGFFSVGDVHGDETLSKRRLVLNEMSLLDNENGVDLIFKGYWLHNEPMIGTCFSLMKNIESLKEHGQLEDAAKRIMSYESNIGHVEKSLTEFSVYGVFHLQRPPELG